MIRKSILWAVLAAFLCSGFDPHFASSQVLNLPAPGTVVSLSPAYKPVMLQGVRFNPQNPLHLDFIVDTGDSIADDQALRNETTRLVRYFLASLTVPNDQLWVNLSPYEKKRIIPNSLALTEMGSELLAQDYLLKQLTASLMGPEQPSGKQFWSHIYSKAGEKYGSASIPLDIFNKVWIVPDSATIEEHQGTAVIVQSHLKVMLEQDYLSMEKHHQADANKGSMANDLIRQLVLPQIEKDVNEGKNFAGLRQVNNALILAAWFKQSLTESLLGQEYANRNKLSGIDLKDRTVKEQIYTQYLKAFKKGVYNYVKDDLDPQTQQIVPRKYFLGGYNAGELKLHVQQAGWGELSASFDGSKLKLASFDLAMLAGKAEVDESVAQRRLEDIRDHHYEGFPVVNEDKDLPFGIKYDLAYYDEKEGSQNNPVRALIRAGKLRAGPDFTGSIKGIADGDGYLVSTDSETELDQELVRLLSGELEVNNYKKWKKAINSKRVTQLTISTTGVIAKPMEVLKRYGVLDLMLQRGVVQMQDIVDHVRALNVDGAIIKYNTPNIQYIAGVLRALASLGWLKIQGESASYTIQYTLTPNGRQAFRLADRFAEVSNFMPVFSEIADYLFNRQNARTFQEVSLTLSQLAQQSKNGWDIPATVDKPVADLVKGQLDGYLVINLSLALWQKKVFDLFDDNLEISLDKIVDQEVIRGEPKELKAALDVFVNVGFLEDLGSGRYKLTDQGLATFDKVLNYGVTVSYRPSYDLSERFMFGDPLSIERVKDNKELLVDRDINVLGSGASHKTYFDEIDLIVPNMIAQRLENKEIPSPDQLSADNPFVLSFSDTGSGDGSFLSHIYHLIMNNTPYGDLVRSYPRLYKIEMVGVDYNDVAQQRTHSRLGFEEIPHMVMFGNINDPKQIVRDVKKALIKKFGVGAQLMVIHTRTFLDHNRPWKDVEDKQQADSRISTSTGTYGWRGTAIPNNYVEQNIYEHFKAWREALKAEGQRDLIDIELHTIPPEVAAANIGKTLDVPYWLSHALSDQFIIEFPIYEARVREAGFAFKSSKLFRESPLTTISVDYLEISDMAMHNESRPVPGVKQYSPFGGINLNPDLGYIRLQHDAYGEQLPFQTADLRDIDIKGIKPVLVKFVSWDSSRLLDE